MHQKYIILDRDGVINQECDDYVRSPEGWKPIPGSLEAIAQLNHLGYFVLVATNQSGIGRNYYTYETLEAIHQKMHRVLAEVGGKISAVFFCPHHPDDHCLCRKPKTGLIDQIKENFPIVPRHTWFIGDSLSDIQTAQRSGCVPVLVKTGRGQYTLNEAPLPDDLLIFNNLAGAAHKIMIDQEQQK